METHLFLVLLFYLIAITGADQFIFPEDANAIDKSPNQVFLVGKPQTFIWSTSAASVTLNLWQDAWDDSDTLCQNCTGSSYTWNGLITQNLSRGAVFFLQLSDGGTATSRYFNISAPSSPSSATAAPSSSPSHQVQIASTPDPSSATSTTIPPSTSSLPSTTSTPHPAPSVPVPISSIPVPHLVASPSVSPSSPSPLSNPSSTSTTTSPSSPSTSSYPQTPPSTPQSPLKLSLAIGVPILSLGALTTLFFLLRRRRNKPVHAQSPPPWSGPVTVQELRVGNEERKGYERVEMDVPASLDVVGRGEKADGGGVFVKAELENQVGKIEKVKGEERVVRGVELP